MWPPPDTDPTALFDPAMPVLLGCCAAVAWLLALSPRPPPLPRDGSDVAPGGDGSVKPALANAATMPGGKNMGKGAPPGGMASIIGNMGNGGSGAALADAAPEACLPPPALHASSCALSTTGDAATLLPGEPAEGEGGDAARPGLDTHTACLTVCGPRTRRPGMCHTSEAEGLGWGGVGSGGCIGSEDGEAPSGPQAW